MKSRITLYRDVFLSIPIDSVLIIMLLPLLLLSWVWIATPALASPPIHEQLQDAIDAEDWDQAISIVDRLIEIEAQGNTELKEYRHYLIQQQQRQAADLVTEDGSSPNSVVGIATTPTVEEAKASLLGVCLSEINTIPLEQAWFFCHCTVDEIQQRYDIVELVVDLNDAIIRPEDPSLIYEACEPGLD